MLDTNICSFIIRGHSPAAEKRLIQIGPRHEIVISAVVYFELRTGALNKKASARLTSEVAMFVERLTGVLPWDQQAAESASIVDAALSAEGARIGAYDVMIAGHALAARCVLVTNNAREFERVKGLEVEDWSL